MIQVKVYLNAYQKRQFVGILEQRDQLLFEYAPASKNRQRGLLK